MTDTQFCSKCKTEKALNGFYERSPGKLAYACKECVKSAKNKRYAENAERMRENARKYRDNDIEAHRKREREYSRRNAESRDARVKAFYEANPHKSAEYNRKYIRSDKGRHQYLRYYRETLRNCENYKIATSARNMLKRTLVATGSRKNGSTKSELGYSPLALKQHIEKQFADGMGWGNYGLWHIDHIIPVAEMIRLGVICPKKINALKNLRPMWASENQSKGARFALVAQCRI
jgi:hypothetical protein